MSHSFPLLSTTYYLCIGTNLPFPAPNSLSSPANKTENRAMSLNTALPPATRSTNPAAAITPDHPTPAGKKKGQCIRLVPQKPSSKCMSAMDSPSSILAAVTNYNSIRDALQGNSKIITARPSSKRFQRTIYKHFGECPRFQEEFKSILDKSTSPYFASAAVKKKYSYSEVEKAFHESVRHECSKACFLRAYGPIREYCFVWRDICFRRLGTFGLTKARLLDGWRCQLVQPQPESIPPASSGRADATPGAAGKAKSPSICPTVFVSSSGEEFDKKAKLIRHLNDLYINAPESFLSARADPSPHMNMGEIVNGINPLFSPLGLLEELYTNDPWKLLLSTHFLNKTQRNTVDPILFKFLHLWPSPESAASASSDEIYNVIAVLGLGDKRSKGVVRFSKEYLQLIADKRDSLEHDGNVIHCATPVEFNLSEKEVMSLHFCGKYAWTAYKLFILKELPETDTFEVCDHALKLYTEYKLGLGLASKKMKENSLQAADFSAAINVAENLSAEKEGDGGTSASVVSGEASSNELTSPTKKSTLKKPKSSSKCKSGPKSALVSHIKHPQPKQSLSETQLKDNELDTEVSGTPFTSKKLGKRPPILSEKDALVLAAPVDGLPDGWVQRRFPRRSGKQVDIKIYTPQMKIVLRSKVEARRLLAKLDEAGGNEALAWQLIQYEKGTDRKPIEITGRKKRRKTQQIIMQQSANIPKLSATKKCQ